MTLSSFSCTRCPRGGTGHLQIHRAHGSLCARSSPDKGPRRLHLGYRLPKAGQESREIPNPKALTLNQRVISLLVTLAAHIRNWTE